MSIYVRVMDLRSRQPGRLKGSHDTGERGFKGHSGKGNRIHVIWECPQCWTEERARRMGWAGLGRNKGRGINHSHLHIICHKDTCFCAIIKKATYPCLEIKIRNHALWVSLGIGILHFHSVIVYVRIRYSRATESILALFSEWDYSATAENHKLQNGIWTQIRW